MSKLRGREFFTEDDEHVFVSDAGDVLGYDALSRRYRASQKHAGLRPSLP